MKLNWRILLPLGIAAVAGALAILSSDEPENKTAQNTFVPCPAETKALLDGLEVGQDLGLYSVTSVRCSRPDVLEIELARDETSRLRLTVAAQGATPHRAPKQTSKHDLFYSRRSPQDASPSEGEISELLTLLAERVESAEKKSAAPQNP
ncbi:MAG: hypothetical protein HUU21_04470 [Polyangiaceae bacterium]|nr:hypothetical protein [Polyangiaceae bacterium]